MQKQPTGTGSKPQPRAQTPRLPHVVRGARLGAAAEPIEGVPDAVLAATAADLCRELGWQVALANTLLRLAAASRRTGDDHVAEAAQAEAAAILRLTGRDLLEPSHGAAATIPSPVAASPAWPSADDSHPTRAAS